MRTCHLSVLLFAGLGLAGPLPEFKPSVLASGLKMGYQMVLVDLNGDGRLDVVVVDERATELAWFENPGWQRHVLLDDAPRALNIDFCDIDGDGKPEAALALRFETNPEKSVGNLLLLKSGADVRQKWTAREIDRVPTAHRVRFIDVDGNGRKALLMAPMIGLASRPPDYADHAPIYIYRPGEWKRELLSNELSGILHSIAPTAWRKGKREQLLTASFLGLHLFEPGKDGRWNSTRIAAGDPRPCPLCGSSEVKVGHLGKTRFLAVIEPWHGNQVVVYLPDGKQWKRIIIDDSMTNGHALAVGDLDGDGRDEIVAGFRGKDFRTSVFQAADAKGAHWTRTVLDQGGVASADCKIADMNGDKRPDIVCAGASTGNVMLFENLGRPAAH